MRQLGAAGPNRPRPQSLERAVEKVLQSALQKSRIDRATATTEQNSQCSWGLPFPRGDHTEKGERRERPAIR